MSPEKLFLEQLPLIDRVIASVCRRHAFYGADAEDFASTVKLKLMDDDYAVLRKFRGQSGLQTYLMTVVVNQMRDHLIHKRGKWRASAVAKRLGAVAVALETMLYRERCWTLDEAVERIARHDENAPPRQRLYEIAAQLAPRSPRRFEGEESLAGLVGERSADAEVLSAEREALLERARACLHRAIVGLDAEERLALQLWFEEGLKAKEIGDRLGLAQRQVYTAIERAKKKLRRELEEAGISSEVLAVLDEEDGG